MSSNMSTLTVSPGVELAYTDTGAPKRSSYATIFAIHGMCFTNQVFKRLQSAAFAKGFRFVAINRRPFTGSTPFSQEEINLIVNVDSNAQRRAAFIEARGHELALFIDTFTQKFKTGASILFGWSMGTQFASAVIAYSSTLPPDVRSRVAQSLRSVVLYDTSPSIMGMPEAPKNWAPLVDTSVSESFRLPMFGQWVTSYFDNGNYSKRDFDTLAYVLPSIDRTPTIFSMDASEQKSVLDFGRDSAFDLPLLFFFSEELKTTFVKAFGTAETAEIFPNLKKRFIIADRSPSFAFTGMWAVQNELKNLGMGQDITYKIAKGFNHFMHWDNPEEALELIIADI